MLTYSFAFFMLLLQTPRAPQSRHPTCVVIHGVYVKDGKLGQIYLLTNNSQQTVMHKWVLNFLKERGGRGYNLS